MDYYELSRECQLKEGVHCFRGLHDLFKEKYKSQIIDSSIEYSHEVLFLQSVKIPPILGNHSLLDIANGPLFREMVNIFIGNPVFNRLVWRLILSTQVDSEIGLMDTNHWFEFERSRERFIYG
jgi:hypothetical protein